MRKSTALIPALALLLGSCASMGELGGGGLIFKTLIGQHLSVGFPKALDFPDEMTLKLSGEASEGEALGRSVFAAVAGGSLEQKAGQAIKKAGLPVREMTATAFREELEKAKLFGAVKEGSGDLLLSLGVGRYGLEFDAAAGKILPVMDLEAALSFKGVNVWRGSRSAAQVGADVKSKLGGLNLAGLIANAGNLKGIFQSISKDLSRQLVEEIRAKPPKVSL